MEFLILFGGRCFYPCEAGETYCTVPRYLVSKIAISIGESFGREASGLSQSFPAKLN
jgi:hypothetical protein